MDELEAARKAKRKKLLKAQRKAKQQAEAAAAAAAAAANGQEEEEGPCRRLDCIALRDSDELEEKIFDERIEVEDKLKEKSSLLESIKQRVIEAEMETKGISEKNKWLQGQIKTKSGRVAELEEERDGLEDVIKGIMNNIMVLQVESQKARSLARQAQEALVNAMWRKEETGGKNRRQTLAGEPLMPLVIKKSKKKPPPPHWVRYTDLASGEATDQSEILPGTSTGSLMESMTLKAPETTTGGGLQGSFGATGGGLGGVTDIWNSPGKQQQQQQQRGSSTKKTGKRTKSAVNNRKIMLLMNTRKKGKGGGRGKGIGAGLGGLTGTKKPARGPKKSSALADIKAEGRAMTEEGAAAV